MDSFLLVGPIYGFLALIWFMFWRDNWEFGIGQRTRIALLAPIWLIVLVWFGGKAMVSGTISVFKDAFQKD